MKLSTTLTALLLFVAAFCLYGQQAGPGFFADEQPSQLNPECPEQLQARTPFDLRAPGRSELDQPLGRLALGLVGAIGERDLRGTSALSWRRANALLHALVCLALYWVFSLASGSRSLAWLGALLFALHPMLVESVSWISMGSRLLSALWVCLGIGLWFGEKGALRYLALPLCLLAYLSHPIAMPAGLVILAITLSRQGVRSRQVLFGLLCLALGIAGLLVAHGNARDELGLLSRLGAGAAAIRLHLQQACLPLRTGDIVVHPGLGPGMGVHLLGGWVLLLLLLGLGLWLLARAAQELKLLGIGLLWFVGFSYGSALLPYGQSIGSDADAYLALPGLLLAGLGLAAYLLRGVARMPRSLSAVCALLIAYLGYLSTEELKFRSNSIEFLKRALDAERSIQDTATNFVAHRRLGLEYLWHGDLSSADAHLRHGLTQFGQDAEALVGRATVAMQRDEKQKARDLLQQACEVDPGLASAWERRGELNLREGTAQHNLMAIECLERALECDPHFTHAYARLASLLSIQYGSEQAAQLARARLMAQRALALEPGSKEAWKALGAVRARTGDLPGAIAAFESSLGLEPDYSEALAGLGPLLWEGGQLERGLAVLERAYNLHPLDPMNAFTLAGVLLESGRTEEARKLFLVTKRLNPGHMRAQENLGWIHLNAGDVQAAIKDGEGMLAIRTGHPGARLLLAEAYQRVGRYAEAITCLRIAIGAQAGQIEAEARLALLLAAAPEAEQRNGARALELAEELVARTQGQHVNSLRALAAAEAELGNFEGALRAIEKAGALDSGAAHAALSLEKETYAAKRALRIELAGPGRGVESSASKEPTSAGQH